MVVRRRPGCAASLLGCLLGVAGSSSPLPGAAAPPTTGCSTPSTFGTSGRSNEVHGTSVRGQLWGLALGPGHIPPRSGDEFEDRLTNDGYRPVACHSHLAQRQATATGLWSRSACGEQLSPSRRRMGNWISFLSSWLLAHQVDSPCHFWRRVAESTRLSVELLPFPAAIGDTPTLRGLRLRERRLRLLDTCTQTMWK